MLDKYKRYHIKRIIEATNNLFESPDSICHKCHSVSGDLNCFFCYCPLYDEEDCGGDYVILNNGLKDCSNCLRPHSEEFVEEQLMKIL
jgi:iron complex transport system ATP-binding protein